MTFLEDDEVVSVREYMDAAMLAKIGLVGLALVLRLHA